jgi:hypothetical protein
MRFAPPEVEKTLQYIRSMRQRRRTQQSPTDQNDEQVDDLLWVPRDVQDERICYLWWRCNNNNDLDMKVGTFSDKRDLIIHRGYKVYDQSREWCIAGWPI